MKQDKKIIIVGAGVFGLSTALHLAKSGYRNVHLYDHQAYDQNEYKYSEGCVAASVDDNKILRASYGPRKSYQDLAFTAIAEWDAWNKELAETPPGDLPHGLKPETKLWDNCGLLRISENGLEPAEDATQRNLPSELKHTQYRISDEKRIKQALEDGIPATKLDPFGRFERGLDTDGFFDTTAGYALASRACVFALHKCKQSGVQTHLGKKYGMKSLIREGKVIKGIITTGGESCDADLVIVACGSWTPSILPEIEDLVESTSGSVISLRLPKDRPDLWNKYSPERFPVWCFNMTTYEHGDGRISGIFGFPRTPEGVIKLCSTGAQWTNYTHQSKATGRKISYPETSLDQIPEEAMRYLRDFCEENMPDLLEIELETIRLCWYSDSVDESFLIDYVPNTEGLMVCGGASGHGFKFLPVLGTHVVDVIEGKDTEYTRLFKFNRKIPEKKKNWLEKGPAGWKTLDKQKLVGKEAWRTPQSTGGILSWLAGLVRIPCF